MSENKFSISEIEKAFARGGALIMYESLESTKDFGFALNLGELFGSLISKSIYILTEKKGD